MFMKLFLKIWTPEYCRGHGIVTLVYFFIYFNDSTCFKSWIYFIECWGLAGGGFGSSSLNVVVTTATGKIYRMKIFAWRSYTVLSNVSETPLEDNEKAARVIQDNNTQCESADGTVTSARILRERMLCGVLIAWKVSSLWQQEVHTTDTKAYNHS